MKCAAFSADSENRIPLFAKIATGMPQICAKPRDQRRAVELLELVEHRAVDEPRDHLAHVVLRGQRLRHDAVELADVVERLDRLAHHDLRPLGAG